MPLIYGCGRSGRIHRNVQELHDPENPKPSRYSPKERKPKGSGSRPVAVLVTDMNTGIEREYPSTAEAARALGCSMDTVRRRAGGATGAPYDGRWLIRRAEAPESQREPI